MVMQPPEDGAMNVRGQETHNQSRSYSIKARRRLTKLEGEKNAQVVTEGHCNQSSDEPGTCGWIKFTNNPLKVELSRP